MGSDLSKSSCKDDTVIATSFSADSVYHWWGFHVLDARCTNGVTVNYVKSINWYLISLIVIVSLLVGFWFYQHRARIIAA